MTDDLTPEEKEALQKLPRERMPSAELEGRVASALRERGILKKRRHAIDITGGRVTALVAASVALVMGAYAIGLHRGGAESHLVPTGAVPREAPYANETAPASPATDEARQDQPRANEDVGETAGKVERQESIAEMKKSAPAEEPTLVQRKAAEQPAQSRTASGMADVESAAPAARALVPSPQRTFLLNGFPVVVDAPDSVSVTQDATGTMLLIQTSDGVIRIRPAGDR